MPTAEEYAALLEALAEAKKGRENLVGELRVVRTERDLLKEQLNKFKRQLFAAKSEAGATHQKDMFFNEAEVLGAEAQSAVEDGVDDDKDTVNVPAHKRTVKRGRKPLDPNLPRHVVRHEVPESERVCPHDGAVLQEIGVVTSEQMDIIPQQLRVILHERVKYACPCCDGGLRLAAKPAQVIPKGLFTESLLAWVITSKYMDGLPLYRQAALLGRFGGSDLSRNTLAASVVRVGQAVQPVINLLRDHVLDAPLIYGDETEIQVLKEAGRTARSKSYMWAQMANRSGPDGTGPPIRLFAYSPSRSTEAAERLYVGVRDGTVLMTDGYEVYNEIAKAHKLVHLGCWAHCRRYFHDAMQALPKNSRGPEQLAVRFIDLIAKLYRVEALAKEAGLDHEGLKLQRQDKSTKVLKEIEKLLLANLHAVLPGSLLGKALHYMASQWAKLVAYVTDGHYPIDNNACENSIRPFVVGRRNWCSPTRSAAPTPARTCTRCWRPARQRHRRLRVPEDATGGAPIGHNRRGLRRTAALEHRASGKLTTPSLSPTLHQINDAGAGAQNYELPQCRSPAAPQHLLNFFPLPHGQGSLRPTLGCIDLATSR